MVFGPLCDLNQEERTSNKKEERRKKKEERRKKKEERRKKKEERRKKKEERRKKKEERRKMSNITGTWEEIRNQREEPYRLTLVRDLRSNIQAVVGEIPDVTVTY